MTYSIHENGSEDGACNSLAILGVIDAAGELLMPTSVQETENAENDDGEDGDDGAGESSTLAMGPRES